MQRMSGVTGKNVDFSCHVVNAKRSNLLAKVAKRMYSRSNGFEKGKTVGSMRKHSSCE